MGTVFQPIGMGLKLMVMGGDRVPANRDGVKADGDGWGQGSSQSGWG